MKHMRLKHMNTGIPKTLEIKNSAPDNTEYVGEPVPQEPGESLNSKADVVNNEYRPNVNDVDQPDSTDPTE